MAGLTELLAKVRWRLTSRRCMCREVRLRGSTVERGGVKHRVGRPCYYCDAYGDPV